MHLRTIGIAALLGIAVVTAQVQAQENGRYQLERSEDGFVRLDTVTGQVSFCTEERGRLACENAEDDSNDLRQALATVTEDRDRLRAENDELRTRLEDFDGYEMDELPSEEEMEEVASWVERMLVLMMRTVRNAEEEMDRESGN